MHKKHKNTITMK